MPEKEEETPVLVVNYVSRLKSIAVPALYAIVGVGTAVGIYGLYHLGATIATQNEILKTLEEKDIIQNLKIGK